MLLLSHAGVVELACPQSLKRQLLQAGIHAMFYTYVIKSESDHKLYIGWTDNLKSRIEKHNAGKVVATKSRIPFTLVYYEACNNKEKAIKREKQLKTGFGRKYLRNRT